MQTGVFVSPYSECEQVWSQQGGNKNEENIRGEDSSLHHLCLPNTEGALLFWVLKHKLSAKKKTNKKMIKRSKIVKLK